MWLILAISILITATLTTTNEELDTGQDDYSNDGENPDLNYKKVQQIINRTNEEVITRTIIKPVSYSYIAATIPTSSSDDEKTAVHVQRKDQSIHVEQPPEEIQQHEESQIRPKTDQVVPYQVENLQRSQKSDERRNQQPVNQPVKKRSKSKRKKIVKYVPVLVKRTKPRIRITLKKKKYYPYKWLPKKKIVKYDRPIYVTTIRPELYQQQQQPPRNQQQQQRQQIHLQQQPQQQQISLLNPPSSLQEIVPVATNPIQHQLPIHNQLALQQQIQNRPLPTQNQLSAQNQVPNQYQIPAHQPLVTEATKAITDVHPIKGDILKATENRPQQRTVKFPLNTVLPGNSIHLRDENYPELLPAINSFSDLSPSRSPNEGLVVSHNEYSGTPQNGGQTTRSHTTISNRGRKKPNQSLREYSASTNNYKDDDGGSRYDKLEYLKVGNGDQGEQSSRYKSARTSDGGGGDGHRRESSGGSEHKSDHSSKKGEKGEKGYKKKHKHDKGGKGHHEKENHSGEYEEKKGDEKKSHDSEGYYGEHHKAEKGEKSKKFGEGGKHKKGHSTHGEHNIVKKNEYIKSTKFYDEDHDGGHHEEHGEFYGSHGEKKGGHKKGGHEHEDHDKKEYGKKGHHDKGHEEEEHKGHDSEEGHEDHYAHEEEFGSKKGGDSAKKWSQSGGGGKH